MELAAPVIVSLKRELIWAMAPASMVRGAASSLHMTC